MKNIGIIGLGFVGTAVLEGMKHAFNITTYDKAGKTSTTVSIKQLVDLTDGPIFVCVPTPMNGDGSCNIKIVEEVVAEIDRHAQSRVVVIKSTVLPGTTERLNREVKNCVVCFNPEFLTERNYIDDFKNQKSIVIGGPREGTNVLKQVYETAYPKVPVTKTSSTIAELVKYTTNCFLATKVSFANEVKLLCDKMGVDFDKVVEYATKDERLGTSHWAVPGPDSRCGFGGSCFPKDLNAILSLAKELGIDVNTMQGAWDTNLHVRPEKDWESLKGRAVV